MDILAMIIAYGIMLFALYWVIRKAVAADIRDARERPKTTAAGAGKRKSPSEGHESIIGISPNAQGRCGWIRSGLVPK